MNIKTNTYDTSPELFIQRYQGGIRLLNPDSIESGVEGLSRVSDILSLPMNSYFVNRDSLFIRSNETNALASGFDSAQSAINHGPRDAAKKEFADRLIANNNTVMAGATTAVIEESGNRPDDIQVQTVSFKMPWYVQDKIVGLLGLSIMLQGSVASSLSNCLSELLPTGLLGVSPHMSSLLMPGKVFKGKYFTKKEYEVLPLLIRGKTAKEIGELLHVSRRTIEHRIERLKLKFNCSSKSELLDVLIGHLI